MKEGKKEGRGGRKGRKEEDTCLVETQIIK